MHVVLVEPSGIGLKVLTRMLHERGDSVTAFSDGAGVLDFIEQDETVDVVITSFEVGSKSGLELCWEVRLFAHSMRPIYTIAMSSTYENSKLSEALDSGADDFIKKPPQVTELYARLRAAERLLLTQRELIRLASIDSLTGIYNRRVFFDKAGALCGNADETRNIAAIMFDIDHFKRVNDCFGHDVGDEAIRRVAGTAEVAGSIAGRLGGEEFALLLDGRCERGGTEVAEQMRRAVEQLRIETPRGVLEVTCSYGVSSWAPGEDVDTVLKRADTALYHAKHNGRNQVVGFESLLPPRRSRRSNPAAVA